MNASARRLQEAVNACRASLLSTSCAALLSCWGLAEQAARLLWQGRADTTATGLRRCAIASMIAGLCFVQVHCPSRCLVPCFCARGPTKALGFKAKQIGGLFRLQSLPHLGSGIVLLCSKHQLALLPVRSLDRSAPHRFTYCLAYPNIVFRSLNTPVCHVEPYGAVLAGLLQLQQSISCIFERLQTALSSSEL